MAARFPSAAARPYQVAAPVPGPTPCGSHRGRHWIPARDGHEGAWADRRSGEAGWARRAVRWDCSFRLLASLRGLGDMTVDEAKQIKAERSPTDAPLMAEANPA